MTHTTSKLESALHLAAKGFHIFPVVENQKKPPLIEGWQSQATCDPKQLRAVWQYKPNLNIGCFVPDGFSLDFDVKKGGLESLKRMEEAGLLPRTHMQRSATGGFHKTYRCSIEIAMALKNAAGHIPGFPGVDVRSASKGYIVGAGSTTTDGVYTIADDAAIANAPTALLELLPKEEPKRGLKFEAPAEDADSEQEIARAMDYLNNRAPEAIEGQRGDDTTIIVCNGLYDYHLSEETAFHLLQEWNETKAHPPWNPEELLKKLRSARKSRKSAVGSKSPSIELEAVEPKDLRTDQSTPPPGEWDQPADLWKEEKPPEPGKIAVRPGSSSSRATTS